MYVCMYVHMEGGEEPRALGENNENTGVVLGVL